MIMTIALVLQVFMALVIPAHGQIVTIPAVDTIPGGYDQGCMCTDCYWSECYLEAEDEFTALFNGYSYKLSKNGRSMVNGKFVKMGV